MTDDSFLGKFSGSDKTLISCLIGRHRLTGKHQAGLGADVPHFAAVDSPQQQVVAIDAVAAGGADRTPKVSTSASQTVVYFHHHHHHEHF